jgi:hypothetical protein
MDILLPGPAGFPALVAAGSGLLAAKASMAVRKRKANE